MSYFMFKKIINNPMKEKKTNNYAHVVGYCLDTCFVRRAIYCLITCWFWWYMERQRNDIPESLNDQVCKKWEFSVWTAHSLNRQIEVKNRLWRRHCYRKDNRQLMLHKYFMNETFLSPFPCFTGGMPSM